jgi:hypothetical protein
VPDIIFNKINTFVALRCAHMSEFTDNQVGEKTITLVNHGFALSAKADGLPEVDPRVRTS